MKKSDHKHRYEQMSQKDCFGKINQFPFKKVLSLVCHKKEMAGFTIEAAAALPLFLLFCAAIVSFLLVLNLQMNLQLSMEETARSMGKKAYLLEQMQSGNSKSKEADAAAATLMSVGINPSTIKAWILLTGDTSKQLQNSRIIGGSAGLYTFSSSYDESEGILDIVAAYDYSFPWLPKSWGTLRFVQRIRSHVWVGESLEDSAASSQSDKNKVYVTPNGSVYHTSKSCHYLDLSIHTTAYASINKERNLNGGKYERCSECAGSGEYETVYITDYGTNWHASLSCSGLKRTIQEVDISETEGKRQCSKCKNGNE